jgi:hypothetical protein
MMTQYKSIFFFVSIRIQAEGLSMGINPTQHVQMFPVAEISKPVGESPYTTALQRHHEDESSKEPSQGLARPAGRPIRLEKGSVVDVYV